MTGRAAKSYTERRTVLDALLEAIDRRLCFAGLSPPDTRTLDDRHRAAILNASSDERFEREVNRLLLSLGTSHTGFYHRRRPRVSVNLALDVRLAPSPPDGARWAFARVGPGGAAARAGIAEGDLLVGFDDDDIRPPERWTCALGRTYELHVQQPNGAISQRRVDIPTTLRKLRTLANPTDTITATRLTPTIGLLRCAAFPGSIGIDTAQRISAAIASLRSTRLIVDLRAHAGGGIGGLRLLSLLCADRRGICYTLTRRALDTGRARDDLPRFSAIPRTRLGGAWAGLRFWPVLRDGAMAVSLFTEALGPQPFHGRVVVLIDQQTSSSGELVAAAAREQGPATVIGMPTPGRLVWAGTVGLPAGYRLAGPMATVYTWQGASVRTADLCGPRTHERMCSTTLSMNCRHHPVRFTAPARQSCGPCRR